MFQHKQAGGAGSAVQFPIDRPFDVQACSRYPYRQQAFDISIRNDVTEDWRYIERVVKGFKSLSLYSTLEAGFLIFYCQGDRTESATSPIRSIAQHTIC